MPFAATANLTAAYFNVHAGKDAKPVEPADLIPGARAARPKPKPVDSSATLLAQFRALAAAQKQKP